MVLHYSVTRCIRIDRMGLVCTSPTIKTLKVLVGYIQLVNRTGRLEIMDLVASMKI